jgi:polyisoprenoid-binding protein YceI
MSTATTSTRTFEGVTVPVAGTFEVDASHSSVSFTVRHLMVSKVRGHFDTFSGTITVGDDVLASQVVASADAGSINTKEPQRDGHLRSADFLDVEQFPTVEFASTALRHVKGDDFQLDADVTIHGVTVPVTFDLEFAGVSPDPWGGERIGLSAKAEVSREDFGLTWNQALETGGVVVGKKATIELEIEAVRQA